MDWIHLSQYIVLWQELVNTVMNWQVPQKAGNVLFICGLFKDAVSASNYAPWIIWLINNKLEEILEKPVVA
jgi:hypothetical protein